MQRDLVRLGHMLDAGEAIVESVKGVTLDQLRSDEVKAKYSEVEWGGAKTTGNEARHPSKTRRDLVLGDQVGTFEVH